MQLKDVLAEMPYLHPGEMPITKHLAGDYSPTALLREFNKLGSIRYDDVMVDLLIQRGNRLVVAIDFTVPLLRYKPLFKLVFKQKHELRVVPDEVRSKQLLQVNSVALTKTYQMSGIASSVYKILADRDFAIISDSTQFVPGATLWKKLAQDPQYTVIVTDVDYGPFRDEDGNTIKYNGTNIPDSDIWSSGSDFAGNNRVFVLSK